jgi:hypothetical protein
MPRILSFTIVLTTCFFNFINAKTWMVGAARTYTKPSQVASLLGNGDTVLIDGGLYANESVKWSKKDLKIIGLGSTSNRTIIQYTGDLPNGKGIFVFEANGVCDNAYINNIVFDGAQVSDANGANGSGIRFQAKDLRVENCKFMNCQNGILEGNGAVSTSNVYIMNSEFVNNGYQLQNDPTYSGYEHNIYISASADTLWVEGNWFHKPRGQANSLKTRAQRCYILYNYIDEEYGGYGSWEINIAQGGLNVIMGNVIIQGTNGANHSIVGYDAATNTLEDFYFINNTVVNQYKGNVKYFNVVPATGVNTYKIYNNIFSSCQGSNTSMFSGNVPSALDTAANVWDNDYLYFGFENPLNYNYLLKYSATQALDKGVNAGVSSEGFSLVPEHIFGSGSNMQLWPRLPYGPKIDLGAYEFIPPIGIQQENKIDFTLYPNPSRGTLQIKGITQSVHCKVYSITGALLLETDLNANENLDVSQLEKGVYFLSLNGGGFVWRSSFWRE